MGICTRGGYRDLGELKVGRFSGGRGNGPPAVEVRRFGSMGLDDSISLQVEEGTSCSESISISSSST